MNVILCMKKIFLALLFFSLMLNVYSQNSVSLGFRRSLEGKEFSQNQLSLNFHSLKDNHEFIYGLGLTSKPLDYAARYTTVDYSHGSPGEYMSTTETYRYSSEVNYDYLGGLFSVNWSLLSVPKFAVFFGVFVNGQVKIRERGTAYNTKYTYDHVSNNNLYGYSSSHKESESFEAFDPLDLKRVYGSIGIHLSNRFYLKDFFIQGYLSCGFVSPTIYHDRLGGECEPYPANGVSGSCFNYENIGPEDQFSLYTSAG